MNEDEREEDVCKNVSEYIREVGNYKHLIVKLHEKVAI